MNDNLILNIIILLCLSTVMITIKADDLEPMHPPASIVADGTNGASAVFSCSHDDMPVMELVLTSQVTDYGMPVRVVVMGEVELFEQREDGVLGAVLSPDAISRLTTSIDNIKVIIWEWSGYTLVTEFNYRLSDWLKRIPCYQSAPIYHALDMVK